jgi:hypothetical protein
MLLPGLGALAGLDAGGGAGSLSAEVSENTVSKTSSTTGGAKTLTTSNISVAASGGTPGYTYSWVRISGSSSITATAPSSAATAFTGTLSANQELNAVFQCTVTDSSGATVLADPVLVDLELIGFS